MPPIYRYTYMKTWTDALAEGYSTVDARALAELEAKSAVEKERKNEGISGDNSREDSREMACA